MGITNSFNKLVSQNNHRSVISLLQDFRKSRELSVDELGWVYWNVSDRYALLRDPEHEYANHLQFVDWGKENLGSDKFHWLVSDGTQALTLSIGSYYDKWIEWYLYACNNSTKLSSNRAVRFESHRAAIYSLIKLKKTFLLDAALNNMSRLIVEDDDWENSTFSRLTYYSLLLERHHLLEEYNKMELIVSDLYQLTDDKLFNLFKDDIGTTEYLLGSWEQLNQSRNTKSSLLVLLHNIGCTLNRVQRYHDSVTVFKIALQRGHTLNKYGLAMYLSSLWNDKKDKNEVLECLSSTQNKNLQISDLFKFAPELKEVLRG